MPSKRASPRSPSDAVSRCRPPAAAHRARRAARRGRTSAGSPLVILRSTGGGAVSVLSIALAGPRWLRVAQREHYLVDAVSRFALRWWTSGPVNLGRARRRRRRAGALVALARGRLRHRGGGGAGAGRPVAGGDGPRPWRGRDGCAPWRWCGRSSRPERWRAGPSPGRDRWPPPRPRPWRCRPSSTWRVPHGAPRAQAGRGPTWRRAAARLRRVAPRVVAITGSFGKTSTKGYVAHLVGAARSVVASPASFNNRAGLARAVNEHLADGTEVFVAEMGTYGRGEIAELCSWIRPDVAVITAIGPRAPRALRVRGPRPARPRPRSSRGCRARCSSSTTTAWRRWPRPCARHGTRVWRVSARDTGADVCVIDDGGALSVFGARGGDRRAGCAVDARPGNVAAAVAVALELGVPADDVAARLPTLPVAPHRLEQSAAPAVWSCSTTPTTPTPRAGAPPWRPCERLGADAPRRVVVTPGMVELGSLQTEENARFAADAWPPWPPTWWSWAAPTAAPCCGGPGAPRRERARPGWWWCGTRPEATEWVRAHLGPGDVVLYENDLPDHYP